MSHTRREIDEMKAADGRADVLLKKMRREAAYRKSGRPSWLPSLNIHQLGIGKPFGPTKIEIHPPGLFNNDHPED